MCLIRDLLPTISFSIYFIWEIDEKVTYVLFVGYTVIFIITNILLKFLYKIKEKILNSEELLKSLFGQRLYGNAGISYEQTVPE